MRLGDNNPLSVLQEYTVKPDVYSFGILLSPVQGGSSDGIRPGDAAADLWLRHRKN